MTLFRRTFTERGAPPGAIVAPPVIVPPEIRVLSYSAEDFRDDESVDPADLPDLLCDDRVTWIDVQGLGDGSIVSDLGERLGLHPLAVADVVHAGQRPKVDLYDGILYLVVHMVTLDGSSELRWEQISMFLGPGFVLTFQETRGDCLDRLRGRIRAGRKSIRNGGADYLACMVVDAIVDGYFEILEHDGERLEEAEERIFHDPAPDVLAALYGTRRDLATFRRAVWPLRDALTQLMRDPDAPISEAARVYLRDTTDHAVQVVEVNESYRELAASLVDVYLSKLSHRTNEIMRVLTVVAAVFIPLTFLAGVYGMNFDTRHRLNMPELDWEHGYLAFWAVSVGVAVALLWAFRRMGWLGRS